MLGHIFISHAILDNGEVATLRRVLENHRRVVWINTEMAPGDICPVGIHAQIETADAFIVLLTENALKSQSVAVELEYAKAVAAKVEGYRLIPIVAEPLSVMALRFMFGLEYERVAIPVRLTPGWAEGAALSLLSALGETEVPLAELRIEFARPEIDEQGGKRRAVAEVRLFFKAMDGNPELSAPRTRFVAPLGPIEDEELRWYLESYPRWPYGPFRERARRVEEALPLWGQALLAGLMQQPQALKVLRAFREEKGERRISVRVEEALSDEKSTSRQRVQEAAARLLSLPWELLHDEQGYLFMGQRGARVRRKLYHHELRPAVATALPLRILLVCPRPDDKQTAYIDHRISALPVVEVVETLGALAELTILQTPTFSALVEELSRATGVEAPYNVVHFNGHGIYDELVGLGVLYFEDEATSERISGRAARAIPGTKLARILRDHGVAVVVLEACQSAMTNNVISASVAGQLLQGGVASVVAMSHSVLVESARRFVATFYKVVCEGQRVGEAMLRAQTALAADPFRGARSGVTLPFELQDWFVPVLYQDDDDPRLIRAVPDATAKELAERRRLIQLGDVPNALPRHLFVGRSHELLQAERMLVRSRYVTLRGCGGEGKTALAAELAHWLVRTRGFTRSALVAFDKLPMTDKRGALQSIGMQLVTNFAMRVASDTGKAQRLVEQALREEKAILVFDNLETVLASPSGGTAEPQVAAELLAWIDGLLLIGETRVILTTREPVSVPLGGNEVEIGRLSRNEAITLVHNVLREAGMFPKTGGETEEMLTSLVETAQGHARSLVLLAPEVARTGVRTTMMEFAKLMHALDQVRPKSRETSLLASVELSLRRLPRGMRERLAPLSAFKGGGHLIVIGQVLGLDTDNTIVLERQLVGFGLAEILPYGYLRFDPALGFALAVDMDDAAHQTAHLAWAMAMREYIKMLHTYSFKNTEEALALTALDLANLLAAVHDAARTAEPAETVDIAEGLETLLQQLGRPSALKQVIALREQAARRLSEWSHATFTAAKAAIERQMADRPDEAAARALLRRAEAGGEQAFPEAAYDIALSHKLLGEVLSRRGAVDEALVPLHDAQRRLEIIAAGGNEQATRMASACLLRRGDCLSALGRFAEAVAAYEGAIGRAEAGGDQRRVAIGKSGLGMVHLRQLNPARAIQAFREALNAFMALGEPGNIAIAWHKLGMSYSKARHFEAAEDAFQSSLRLASHLGRRHYEASTLGELGTLYKEQNRHEEAVRFFRRAIEIHAEFGDMCNEGISQHNAAACLVELNRLDEARRELQCAIKNTRPFGHRAEPWKAFALLADLEQAAGDQAAVAAARAQARAAFLAFRHDRGENRDIGGRLALLVAGALRSGDLAEADATLAEFSRQSNLPAFFPPMLTALTAILHGSRDAALAEEPALRCTDAVELELLLEHILSAPPP